jgi:hypothetical protein
MADATATKSRRTAKVEDDEEDLPKAAAVSTVDDDDDDDDEEEEEEQPKRGRASARAIPDDDDDLDDDDLDDDDDDDDSLVIGEGWEEAKAPTGEFPMVARGTYVIMHSDTEKRKGQESGNQYAVTVWKIQAEDNPSKMEEDDPTVSIWHNLFFTPKAMGRSKKFVSEMGIEVHQGDNIIELLRESSDEETRYEAVIGIERYRREDPETGKMKNAQRNRILKVLGPLDS